jgi:hypothetical protein
VSNYRLGKSVVALLIMLTAAGGCLLPGHVCRPPVASHVTPAVFVAGSGVYPGFVEFESLYNFWGPR